MGRWHYTARPPAGLASLMPDRGVWTFDFAAFQGKGFFLGCLYDGSKVERSIPLPLGAKACRSTDPINVVCE